MQIFSGKVYVTKIFARTRCSLCAEMDLDSGDTHDNKARALKSFVLKDGASYEKTGKNCRWNNGIFITYSRWKKDRKFKEAFVGSIPGNTGRRLAILFLRRGAWKPLPTSEYNKFSVTSCAHEHVSRKADQIHRQ